MHYSDPKNNSKWYCSICTFSYLPDANLELSTNQEISENVKLQSNENLKKFITSCQNINIHNLGDEDDNDNIFSNISSKYYHLHEINKLKTELSSLKILHTNLASLYKYHDDLELIFSIMKTKFQIIGITEHKIMDTTPISNVKLGLP